MSTPTIKCPYCGGRIIKPLPGLNAWCGHCRHVVDSDKAKAEVRA